MKRIFTLVLSLALMIPTPAFASDSQRISDLEKRVKVLENELIRLKKQEERASKYLKCVQNVQGNQITVPFKILNCIRK